MNLPRILLPICLVLLLLSCKEPLPRPVIRIIPLPAQGTDQKGVFVITSATKIGISNENVQLRRISGFLTGHLEKYFGIENNSITAYEFGAKYAIFLKLDATLKLGNEDYHLSVLPEGVLIEAAATNGIFYGVQTLIQLMPPSPKQQAEVILPAVDIRDSPRFAWRGLQLDVSRHFMPKSFILKFLDEMAMHKLNTFHWHLTDDQGWRIEIKKYPRLTEVGSVRKKTIMGHILDVEGIDTVSSSGYYTQNDVMEIVAYASERFITVVPEVGMPGHALAALAAYPELGCTVAPYEVAGRWGIYSDVYCPGKDGTFNFLNDVISEMAGIFPGKYFHVGGAECLVTRWEKCPDCQLRMKDDSLNSTQELQNYFVDRIYKMLLPLGKELVGWDEILKDTLMNKGVVMACLGEDGVISASKKKIQTVVSSLKYYNFDQYQSSPMKEPLAVGGLLTLDQVYNFDPVPKALNNKEARSVIGVEANIWTPYMKTPVFVEYMTFPRVAAFAEVAWSPKVSLNYQWFKKRLAVQLKRYDAEGITYCKDEFKTTTN